jgi:hypothetical protein
MISDDVIEQLNLPKGEGDQLPTNVGRARFSQ